MFKNRQTKSLTLALVVLLAIIFYPKPPLAQGSGSISLSGYAWSSNVGWFSMSGPHYGVTIGEDNHLSGYGWSSGVGWIDFNGVNLVAGKLVGFANALSASGVGGWDGKIAMSGATYGVHVPTAGGNLSGYAWGDVVGWVDFSRVSIPTIEEPPPTCDADGNPPGCVGGGPGPGPETLSVVCPLVNIFGTDATWTVVPSGGVTPYHYAWTINPGPLTGTTQTFTLSPFNPDLFYTGTVVVTDSSTSPQSGSCSATLDHGSPYPPGYITPTVSLALDSSDRMEIVSQPLTSPAISSPTKFTAHRGDDIGATVVVKEIKSLNPNITTDLRTNDLVTCRLEPSTVPIDADDFADCRTVGVGNLPAIGSTDINLNIRVEQAAQSVKAGSPYQVKVGIENCALDTCNANVIFDYRVGNVNPI